MMIPLKNETHDGKPKTRKDKANTLWVEKYRPDDLKDVIMPKRIRTLMEYFVKYGISRHILFFGDTGTGKTTLMRILSKGHVNMKINASKDNGIDVVRNRIVPFGQVGSFSDKPKLTLMDEIDKFTTDAQLAFRGVIEDNASTVRYIATCNYPEKLDKAIRSRFGCRVSFDFNGEERKEIIFQQVKRIQYICEQEGMTINVKAIGLIIHKYTDMRDIIETLQTMYQSGIKDITEVDVDASFTTVFNEFFKMVTDTKISLNTIRTYIKDNYVNQEYEVIGAMGDKMAMWMLDNNIYPFVVQSVYEINHKYKTDSKNSPNTLTSLLANVIAVRNVIKTLNRK